ALRPPADRSAVRRSSSLLLFLNDSAPTEIYTLSLHDALPISAVPVATVRLCVHRRRQRTGGGRAMGKAADDCGVGGRSVGPLVRSEEHTSELQSLTNLVCRLLLEKKKHQ